MDPVHANVIQTQSTCSKPDLTSSNPLRLSDLTRPECSFYPASAVRLAAYQVRGTILEGSRCSSGATTQSSTPQTFYNIQHTTLRLIANSAFPFR